MVSASCLASSWSGGLASSSSSVCCSRSAAGRSVGNRFGRFGFDGGSCVARPGRGPVQKVLCMAHPRRVKMVGQQIRREVAEMLLHDKVLQQAVLPEAGLGADMYLSSVATVSDVQLSSDLQVAKVYISVFGDERGAEIAIEGLRAKAKYVRMGLGKRMQLRMTPEVRFIRDDAMEKGSRVLDILEKLKVEREVKGRADSGWDDPDDNWDDPDDVQTEPLTQREPLAQKVGPLAQKATKTQPKSKPKKIGPSRVSADDTGEKQDWPMDIEWPADDDDVSGFSADERIIFIK